MRNIEAKLQENALLIKGGKVSPVGSVGASEHLRYSEVSTGDPHPHHAVIRICRA